MTTIRMTRRTLMLSTMMASVAATLHAETAPKIHVSKDAECPCCEGWVTYLRTEGFEVSVTVLEADQLAALKAEKGIPAEAQSCHTGEVDGYVIEGHVPAADIRRVLAERPEAVGLAVPGMVFGSPGMGPESRRDAYAVLLMLTNGATEVFTQYSAA